MLAGRDEGGLRGMRKGRGAPCASPRLEATRDLSVLSSRYRLRNGRTTACYSPRLSRPRSTHRQPPVSSRPPPTTSPAFSPCARPIHPRYLYCSIPIHQCVHPTRERRTAPLIHTVPSTVSAVAPSKQLNPILAGQSSSHRAPTCHESSQSFERSIPDRELVPKRRQHLDRPY